MDIGSSNQDMGSRHTIDRIGINRHVFLKIRNTAGRFRFKRLDADLQRGNVGLRSFQRSLQRRVASCQLADLGFEGINLCLQCREETSYAVWVLNQAVPTLVIPFESESYSGKEGQEGTHQNPRHYSSSKHDDRIGCSPGMNVIIRRIHLSVLRLLLPRSQSLAA